MTTQNEEFARIHSYLTTQGERYAFDELWTRLIKARISVMDSVEGVSQELADFRPEPGEWTISEVLHHLLTSSGRVAELVESLSQGVSVSADRIDPPREDASDPIGELRDKLRSDSIAWSALTHRLQPSPPASPTAPHPMFGELHARAWYLFQRVHDLDHAGQIGKNKAAWEDREKRSEE